ncbi:MAG TPA: peptidoglycan DD-metalloendopeptidase family protein [Bacilli bacterium]
MKRRLQILIPLIILFSLVVLPLQNAAASRLEEIDQQLRELEKQKQEAAWSQQQTNNELSKVLQDKKQAQQAYKNIIQLMDQVFADMQKYQAQIDKTNEELHKTAKELDEADKRVAERDKLLREKIRLMYTTGPVKYIDVLMNATSFADFLDRLNFLTAIVSEDESILQANKRDRDLIAQKEKKMQSDLATLNELYDKKAKINQQLMVKEKEKEVVIASLQDQQEDLEEISAEQERQIIQLAAKVSKLNAEKERLFTPSGKLSYPLPEWHPVTSGFGSRVDPITGKRGAFHNGYDLGAPSGTDILAAADGQVIVAQWYGSFGNCVIIDHGNGLWTLYGHMSKIIAKKNQVVKRGQKIGEVGHTGRATGNHLHFTVYLNEQAVDPSKYVNFR